MPFDERTRIEKNKQMVNPQQSNAENETLAALEDEGLSYEDAYARLEQILDALETGDLPLEEALSLYEMGSALTSYCARKLDQAELRVRRWQPDDSVEPFTEWTEE